MGERVPLPKLAVRGAAGAQAISVAQEPWLQSGFLPQHEVWLPIVWRLEGPLDVRAFLAAFQEMVQRHEILRTRYTLTDTGWRPVIGSPSDITLRPIDLSDIDNAKRELLIWERLRVIYEAPVTAEAGVVRLEFFRTGPRSYLLAGFLHHVATDNVSIRMFFDELMDLYMRRVSGYDPVPPPRFQYSDFADWERTWLNSGGREEASTYWRQALQAAKATRLPGGRGRRGPTVPAIGQQHTVEGDQLAAIRATAAAANSTTSALFYAALGLAVAKCSGGHQAVLAAFTQGRPSGFADVMGCFSQLRPFFIDFADNPDLSTVLSRAREAAIAVADFRRPIQTAALVDLDVGGVLVNYVRRPSPRRRQSSESADVTSAATGLSPLQEDIVRNGAAIQANAAATSFAVSCSEAGLLEPYAPWTKETSALSSRSLSSLSASGPPAGDHGLRAGMSRLPQLLQPNFSRDLHIGVLEARDTLAMHVTVGEGGVDQRLASDIVADAVDLLVGFGEGLDRKVSRILD